MGMAAGGGAGSDLQAEINVTPMVDIMLVLLIIFMVITPLLQSGVNVVLPKAEHPEEDQNITKETAVVVALPDAGFYYVGRDLITDKERLIARIKRDMEALKPNDPHIVYIKSGLNVPYGEVVKLVDMIREAGFDQLGLVADKKKPEKGK
jgi:biopolymer transport protein ExbD/biopolymer transport protein TolR